MVAINGFKNGVFLHNYSHLSWNLSLTTNFGTKLKLQQFVAYANYYLICIFINICKIINYDLRMRVHLQTQYRSCYVSNTTHLVQN